MEYKGMEKVHSGAFLDYYDLYYETEDGQQKTYEMVSRNHDLKTYEELHNEKPDAVVLILHDESGKKILLNREFRMAMGRWVYNFPAGLIEKGESVAQAGKRELREETGLTLLSVEDTLGYSYSAVGISNESSVVLVGTAGGSFRESDSAMEEIHAGWYTAEEIRDLMRKEPFAARTQGYCYLWAKQER